MIDTTGPVFSRSELDRVIEGEIEEVRQQLGCQEVHLEGAIRQAISEASRGCGESLSYFDCDRIAESLLLQHAHPDQFVVFRQVKQFRLGRDRLSLEVLFASTDWGEVCNFRRTLTPEERKTTTVEFFRNPSFF